MGMDEPYRKLRNAAKTLVERIELWQKIDSKTDPNYKRCLGDAVEEAVEYIANRKFDEPEEAATDWNERK
jgi:hypothetical protein